MSSKPFKTVQMKSLLSNPKNIFPNDIEFNWESIDFIEVPQTPVQIPSTQ